MHEPKKLCDPCSVGPSGGSRHSERRVMLCRTAERTTPSRGCSGCAERRGFAVVFMVVFELITFLHAEYIISITRFVVIGGHIHGMGTVQIER